MTDTYASFIKKVEEIKDIETLREQVIALKRENFGLKQTIKNLERKLYKRNESHRGNVEPTYRKPKF